MSNILCTGGAGFIGSHLVETLLKENNNITVIDNLSMGKVQNLPTSKNLAFIRADILDNIGIFFQDVDIVFHLGALTRPRESMAQPMETNKVNIEGTLKTLINAERAGVKKFIFVSSASAYGYQTTYPFDERMELNPVSPYAVTKQTGEQYCKLFTDSMIVNSVRPFNVYGTRQSPKGEYASAVPKFIDSLKNGVEPYITGDGKQFRDFVHVDDVVDMLIAVSKSDMNGQVFNCGSGKHTSINALFNTICGIMNKKVTPKYIDPVNDPNTVAGMAKAEKYLNWRPKISLVEGLERMINEHSN